MPLFLSSTYQSNFSTIHKDILIYTSKQKARCVWFSSDLKTAIRKTSYQTSKPTQKWPRSLKDYKCRSMLSLLSQLCFKSFRTASFRREQISTYSLQTWAHSTRGNSLNTSRAPETSPHRIHPSKADTQCCLPARATLRVSDEYPACNTNAFWHKRERPAKKESL